MCEKEQPVSSIQVKQTLPIESCRSKLKLIYYHHHQQQQDPKNRQADS